MTCPSCDFENTDAARYCGRCRMSFTSGKLFLARLREHFLWIFRRSNAGFLSGLVAWAFIPALSRVLSTESSATLYFALEGLLGGAFLGTVDGMVEGSSPKSFIGAVIGGICGAIGGAVFGHFSEGLTAAQTAWGLCAFWAFTGAGIGIVSALWERQPKKLLTGAIAGILGGGIGGGLRYAIYAYLIETFNPQEWFLRRFFEGFSGAIIGVTLWLAIGMAERFVIFKRTRIEGGRTYKSCHHCKAHNPLPHWYCAACGSVLQESASPAALHITPYHTLDRLSAFFRFLSRLSRTTGIIAGIVVFIVFVPVSPLLAIVATLLVAIASYGFEGLFSALSETVRIYIRTPAR
jgi:hypothetical protein